MAAHVWLREVLGGYVGMSPEAVSFDPTEGKPRLAPQRGHEGVRFNLSHSAGRAACAVSNDRDVGIDLERVRPVQDLDDLIRRICTDRERARLGASAEDRLAGFFQIWTLKEAVVKAAGLGLGIAPELVDTSVCGDSGGVVRLTTDQGAETHWTVRALRVPEGWMAAVAAEGEEMDVSIRSVWAPDGVEATARASRERADSRQVPPVRLTRR